MKALPKVKFCHHMGPFLLKGQVQDGGSVSGQPPVVPLAILAVEPLQLGIEPDAISVSSTAVNTTTGVALMRGHGANSSHNA